MGSDLSGQKELFQRTELLQFCSTKTIFNTILQTKLHLLSLLKKTITWFTEYFILLRRSNSCLGILNMKDTNVFFWGEFIAFINFSQGSLTSEKLRTMLKLTKVIFSVLIYHSIYVYVYVCFKIHLLKITQLNLCQESSFRIGCQGCTTACYIELDIIF